MLSFVLAAWVISDPAQVKNGSLTLKDDDLLFFSVAWSPDGRWLATEGQNFERGKVRLWSYDGKPGPELSGAEGPLVWSPEGKWLATGTGDKTVRLWSPTGTTGPVLRGHEESIVLVAWHPGGNHLASSDEKTVRVWSTDGTAVSVIQGHFGHGAGHNSVPWSLDGRYLAIVKQDKVQLLSLNGKPEV
jgi:Tol biopolymer transport system component